jgi:exopolysaccharide biosynthesis polyprenyl glycosylphosphotransferase
MPRQAAIKLRDDAEDPQPVAAPEYGRLAVAPAPAVELAPLSLEALARDSEQWVRDALEPSESLQRRLLALADVVAMAAVLVAVLSRFGIERAGFVALASTPLVVLIFKIAGLYNRDELRVGHSTLDEAPLLLQLTGLFALGAAILHPGFPADSFTGIYAAALWLASFTAIMGGRMLVRSVVRRIVPVERCLIIGEERQADRIRHRMAASPARAIVVDSLAGDDLRRLGGGETLLRHVRDLGVHRIIVAPITTGTDVIVGLIRMAKAAGIRVSVLPRILEVVGSAAAFDEVEGMAMLGVPRFGLGRSSRLLKRAFDIVATTVGLVLISPIITVIALAIRLDSKGPVFFRQIRVGRQGRPFYMVKFRSMVTDADARKDELRSVNVAGSGLFKVADDPRVTRVGRLLRSTSLDELPQLFNVLWGQMSLVGPRPLVTDEDAQVLGLDRSRLRLKPGMTGPWQLLGSRVALQEMVEIDYLYASEWSLWLDLKIMLRTVRYVIRRRNM